MKDSISGDYEIDEGTTIYYVLFREIEEAELSCKAPVSGVATTTPIDEETGMYILNEQTNPPEITAADGEGYAISEGDGLLGSYWVSKAGEGDPFIGTFEGDKSYNAVTTLKADCGYCFKKGFSTEVNGGKYISTVQDSFRPAVFSSIKAASAPEPSKDESSGDKPSEEESSEVKPSELLDTSLPVISAKKPGSARGALTAKWKKLSKKNQNKVQGIEVQCARDKSFTKSVKTVKAGKGKVSKKIKKLAKKKTYYVRVRSYTYADGVKHVSKWSKVKKIKTR